MRQCWAFFWAGFDPRFGSWLTAWRKSKVHLQWSLERVNDNVERCDNNCTVNRDCVHHRRNCWPNRGISHEQDSQVTGEQVMYGIDVSNNNGELKLSNIKPKPQFVLAKCTESNHFVDPTYPYYAIHAEDFGAQFGAYHFWDPKVNGATQGLYFAQHARPRSMLSMWLDYETYGGNAQEDAEGLAAAIAGIKHEFPKQKVGLYFNRSGYLRLLPYLGHIGHSAIWFADPNGIAGTTSVDCQIHQYRFGAKPNPDLDFSELTEDELRTFWEWV
jgi:Glycosyl hydrolases family 25